MRAAAHQGRRDRRDQRACPGRPAQLPAGSGRPPRRIRRACRHRHRPRARYENEVSLGRALAETNREITRSLQVQQRLAEQVLLGDGPGGSRPCWPSISVAASSSRTTSIGSLPALPPTVAMSGAGSSPIAIRTAATATGPEAFSIAVRVGNDVVGHLLLSSDEDLGPIDRALVDVATTGVALEFAKERAAVEVEERLRGEAAAELLTGSYASEEVIGARAARLGYDLSRAARSARARCRRRDVATGSRPSRRRARARTRRGAPRHRPERLVARAPRSLAVLHGGSIVVLAAGQPRERARPARARSRPPGGDRRDRRCRAGDGRHRRTAAGARTTTRRRSDSRASPSS